MVAQTHAQARSDPAVDRRAAINVRIGEGMRRAAAQKRRDGRLADLIRAFVPVLREYAANGDLRAAYLVQCIEEAEI